MTKIDAIVKVLAGEGKVVAVSKHTGRFMSYGAGKSVVWNNTTEYVGCHNLLTDKFYIKEIEKV